jgi:hypothetical protein
MVRLNTSVFISPFLLHTIVAKTVMLPTPRLISTWIHHLNPGNPIRNPEYFWQPIVVFLKEEDVAAHFKPSATLFALTPSTTWT